MVGDHGWLVGWLVGWLIGWLVSCIFDGQGWLIGDHGWLGIMVGWLVEWWSWLSKHTHLDAEFVVLVRFADHLFTQNQHVLSKQLNNCYNKCIMMKNNSKL